MSDQVTVPPDVTLRVIEGVDKDTEFTIENKTITIGRDAVCDMVLTDEHASKKHCQVVFRSGHFTVIDLGSLNSTKVNDRVYVQKNLSNGDIITVGKNRILFTWEGAEEAADSEEEDETTEGGGEESGE